MAKRRVVNIHEAKTHFSELLDRVAKGDDIVIAKAGRPVARLVPIGAPGSRTLGLDAGAVFIASDFDAPLPDDLLGDFEG
jgi:prevent-host-death family protein